MKLRITVLAASLLSVPGSAAATPLPADAAFRAAAWTGAWATSPQRETGPAFANQTLRLLAHPTLGGSSLRIRMANTFGDADVTFSAVSVARAAVSGAADLVAGTSRRVTFGGRRSITVKTEQLAGETGPLMRKYTPIMQREMLTRLCGKIACPDEVKTSIKALDAQIGS